MPVTHLQHIGKMIATLRKFRNLTQDQLAEQAGLRVATISDIERGKQNFEINTLVKIASALEAIIDIKMTSK